MHNVTARRRRAIHRPPIRQQQPHTNNLPRSLLPAAEGKTQVNRRATRRQAFYAQAQQLTPGYLSQVVKAQSGRTAMQWLETFTIWQAGHLLRNSPGMSIKEVAYALRFPDQPGCSGVISGARRGQLARGLPRGGSRRARGPKRRGPARRAQRKACRLRRFGRRGRFLF